MTFTIHIEHEGQVYVLPNYPTAERALEYIRWYGERYGKTKYRIEAVARRPEPARWMEAA